MKRILITGASRGIGQAIAVRLAAPGRHLLLHARTLEALSDTAAAVRKAGAEVECFSGDFTEPKQTEALVTRVAPLRPDVLINNAGIAVVKPFEEITTEEWNRTLAANITAPFLLTRGLAPGMAPGSSIVNILSIAARTGFSNWSSYCMSKFALEGFARSIREELRPRGIRVINIYPASTDTGIWGGIPGDWPREKMLSAVQVAEAVAFALDRPAEVAAEEIHLSNLSGTL